VCTGTETKILKFLITNLGKDEVILRYPWLTAFEPVIHWKDATLDKQCQPIIVSSIQVEAQTATIYTQEEWEEINEEKEGPYAMLRKTTTASELAQKAMDKTPKTFEQMVLEEYRRHERTFNEKESHRFPPERPWDHAIELVPDAPKAFDCKIYPMARGEEDSLWEFIKEQLEKGYIRPSKSPYASPFFFIKKKDGKLRPVQDYHRLNSLTVKNQYPLPLILELIDQLRNATLFTKLDIRWGYNNVRIKEGDQEKGAFKTNLGLYEPCVMFFGLTNSPSTFQTMMDTIFRDLTATGEVIIYMDDILIATPSNVNHHCQLVHQILDKLEEHDLFLKPEKCTFEVPEIEYLGLVIGGGRVRMDRVKVQGVDGWQRPKTLTKLRGWMGFINFYRRFIKGFSNIARVLNELTKKRVPWEWTEEREEAFQKLKRLICEELVLLMPKLEQPFELEVDTSNYAIGATLNQKDELNRWHPVAYYSTTLSETERNYDIYDKELLAVVKSLRHWRTYLMGAPHQIVIHTDHSNLLYWKEPRKISRRIAREFQELQEYNFVLKHIAGTKNARADALSRRPDYDMGEEDNDNVVVLPSEVFIKLASEDPIEELDTCSKINLSNLENEETIRKWTNTYQLVQEHGTWWKEDALVVAGNNNLKRGVISAFHDPPYRGHPGIGNTIALLKQNYWWPNLKKDVEEYVKGCTVCQANKINTHHQKPRLYPITTDPEAQPFKVVTMDFITKLPSSQGYDSILTITDHDCTKATLFIPCNETITSEGVAKLYLQHAYPHYGLPKRLITDRGPQFISIFMKNLCQVLGIKQNISSAYHPQTDGQSERSNQWVEQFLRHWSNTQQDNWADLLPIAQFAHNSWPNATTKNSPFKLLMGSEPRTTWEEKRTTVQAVDDRLQDIQRARSKAQDCIKHAQRLMAERGKTKFTPYAQGTLVWLEGVNLRTHYPTSKLAPKRYSPFPIKKVLSDVSYKLELPAQWKIHPVIHANLLTPYKETALHGPNFTRPPPDLIDGEEEYEAEEIQKVRRQGRGRKLHYLVKWKGFPTSDSMWEPVEHLKHTPELITDFYRRYPTEEGAPMKA